MQTYDFQDKTVMITGASLGIGAAFARELRRRGAKLVLVARERERLQRLADELGGATVIAHDLAEPSAGRALLDAVAARDLRLDVLINNAGFGSFGAFADVPLETHCGQIDLNVRALVELTHAFLPMLQRQRGGIIQVASTASFQPLPFMAVYGASKAFVLSFSEALWAEQREHGVRVLALCPGATDTPFFVRAGEAAAVGKKAAPEDVVRVALRAFDENRSHVVHGYGNYWTAQLSRFIPRQWSVQIVRKVMKPRRDRLAASNA